MNNLINSKSIMAQFLFNCAMITVFLCQSAMLKAYDNCSAHFTYPPLPNADGFYFTSNSTAEGGIATYQWFVNQIPISIASSFTYLPDPAIPTFELCLTIIANNGCTNSYCDDIALPNPNGGECNANFGKQIMPDTPLTAQFNPTAQPEGTTYDWDFGDGTTSDQINPIHTFGSPNQTYQVCLSITQPNGCTNTQCHNLNFEGNPNGGECNANFGKQLMSDTPLTAQFNPTAQPEGTTYDWDFGDGTTSDEINPIHTFGSPNQTYQVCLSITQPNGCTNTQCHNINFEGNPNGGECNANFIMEPLEGTPYGVIFTAAPQPEGTTYAWFLGDEEVANTPTFDYAFAGAGNYAICLSITQANGCTNTQCHNLNFEGNPNGGECNANFMMEPLEGTPYGVIFTAAPQPDGTTYAWFLGDEAVANTLTFDYTFSDAGNYAICLTITQPNGCTNTQCHNINFEGDPNGGECNANFMMEPLEGTPYGVIFTAAPQPEGTTFSWVLGDEEVANTPTFNYTFAGAGNYAICLTITQPNGCTNTQCHNINFEGDPNGGDCNANFGKQIMPDTPLTAQFNPTAQPEGTTYTWDFGDGTTSDQINPIHTFATNGMYQVCLTITNADASCTDTRCKEVYLGNMPPPPPTDGCHAFYHAYHPEGNLLEWHFDNASWGEDIINWEWDFGDGTTAQGQNQTHTYEANGNYLVCLSITNDSATCTNTYCHTIHIGNDEPPLTELHNIGGKVTNADGSLAQYALVYLVRYNNIGGGMLLATDVQVIMPEDEGEYKFQNIPTGNYLVKAALMPLDVNYANNLPTYYLSANIWSEAVTIELNEDLEQIDIQLIAGSNPGGPGFVSGLITEGAGRADAPIATEGLTVMLTTETGTPIAYTFTNADGTFSLANLPYGTYQVWVDVPGMYQQPYTITITPAQSQINNVSLSVSQTATATVEPELNYTLSINPNPTNNYATVDVSFETPTGFVAYMYDLSGKIVTQIVESQANTQHHLTINVANLPAGTYIFEMQVKGQSAIKQKMLKM
ncbi:MAG: DUF2012 domain-containing protein [Chitinophagales bacterium]|nr:DUF2012 domain-containing protein [Chitinophagales bacterium]